MGQAVAKVLLVDDDFQVRGLLEAILTREGFDVVSAPNGAEALRRLPESEPPCVVLLDMMMPVMGGDEFLARVRQEPAWCAIPIVVMSSSAPQPHPLPEGVKGWFAKPFGLEELLATVKKLCHVA